MNIQIENRLKEWQAAVRQWKHREELRNPKPDGLGSDEIDKLLYDIAHDDGIIPPDEPIEVWKKRKAPAK